MKIFYLFTIACCFLIGSAQAQSHNNPLPQDDFEITTFEDLELPPNSYWNGSDLSGGFTSGSIFFPNDYNPDWGTWAKWAYSSMADDSTAGYLNQFSAITAAGFEPEVSGGSTYGVAWVPFDWADNENIPIAINFTGDQPRQVDGLYVTNSTYAALAMENGDGVSKKFGGVSGNDPDYFKLIIFGHANGVASDPIEFYLADYRFENNEMDYIVTTWEWVDLNDFGLVDSLTFTLESSDVGAFGMNTPAYFCVDHITVYPEYINNVASVEKSIELLVFPNPATDFIQIQSTGFEKGSIEIFDLSGRLVNRILDAVTEQPVNVSNLDNGMYLIKFHDGTNIATAGFIKSEK
jgi:hypothetical protein